MSSSVLLLFAHRLIGFVSTKILHKLNVFMSATILLLGLTKIRKFYYIFFRAETNNTFIMFE